MNWQYGVTTCRQRLGTLLPDTLRSLAEAGFDRPRLFIDGCSSHEVPDPLKSLLITCRSPTVGAYGNWILAAWELYVRDPRAERYAIFQDDLVMCHGTRDYLERCEYPGRGYLNLFTFATNEHIIFGKPKGWHRSDQLGKGALALVFDHLAMVTLLQQSHTVDKPQLPNGNQSIDGAVQHALVAQAGFSEYVHCPSLAQHRGRETTIGEDFAGRRHPTGARTAKTFPGEIAVPTCETIHKRGLD